MRRHFLALLVCIPLHGCDDDAPEEAVEPVDIAESEPAEPDPSTNGDGEPAEEAPTEPPPEPIDDPELEELTKTLRAASTAAETYETGSTICEAAHASLIAMMAAVAERYPDQVREAPPKGAFMQACERLPEEAQECLLPRHAMAHVDDCTAITERLDPEQRAYLDQVLGGG